MKPISDEIIDSTRQEIIQLSEQGAQKLMEKMGDQQPNVLAYITIVGDDFFNQSERGFLLYLGLLIWKSFQNVHQKLPCVKGEDIEIADENNVKMLEYLESEPANDYMGTIQTILESYPQQPLFRFIMEAVMETEDESEGFLEENKGIAVIYLKTVIDVLDETISEKKKPSK